MRQLRTVTVLLALVVSGLALVAVAPAPPAAADLRVTLTQGSMNVVPELTRYCTSALGQAESSWLRRFDLGKDGVLGAFTPQEIAFGVDRLTMAPGKGSVAVRVRVYAFPATDATLTWAELQSDAVPYVEDTVELAELPVHRLAFAYPTLDSGALRAFDPVTEDAVVEVTYAGGVRTERFTIGSNSELATAPAYRRIGPICGKNEIESFWPASDGPVIAVVGVDAGKSDLDRDGVLDLPDLDECPARWGPQVGDPPGCPSYSREVTARYDPGQDTVTGTVSGGPADACHGQVDVIIENAKTGLPITTMKTDGETREYDWDPLGWAIGTEVRVKVERFLDRDAAGEGLAVCTFANPQPVVISGPDDDLDGVPDTSDDECDLRWGWAEYAGCPFVAMVITPTTSHDGVVSGTLKVAAPSASTECQRAHEVVLSVGTSTYRATAAATTGAFSFASPVLADNQSYTLSAAHYLDGELAWCGDTATEELVALVDGDQDDVRDSSDLCRAAWGDGETYSGCVELPQVVTAELDGDTLSGTVTATGAVDGACSTTSVQVLGDDGTSIPVTGMKRDGAVRTFEVSVAAAPTSSRVRVVVAGGFDPGSDPPAAYCEAGESASMRLDTDGDGFRDQLDQCDKVAGSVVFAVGCPDLARAVTASYADGVVRGTVSFLDGRATSVACTQREHTRVVLYDLTTNRLVAERTYSTTDGSYSIAAGDLPVGTVYSVHLVGAVDDDAGYCHHAFADNTVIDPDADPDRDDVTGLEDACPQVPDLGDTLDGCPVLERRVTASYDDGVVSGTVTMVDGRPASTCGTATRVRALAYELGSDGEPDQIGETSSSTVSGKYSINVELGLPIGSRYHVVVDGGLNPAAGYCSEADSGQRVVADPAADDDGDGVANRLDVCPLVPDVGTTDDGCLVLARTVTAAYAGGEITGQVSVLGPHPAPAGTCEPTQVRAYNLRGGVPVRVGASTTTTATGSYTITLGGPLAAGSTYYVSTERYRDEPDAVCAEATSASQQVPLADPPGGPVPPTDQVQPADPVPPGSLVPAGGSVAPVGPVLSGVKLTKKAIHVATARATPRSTKLKLGLNVAAKVVVTIKGKSRTTGRKVKARLVLTLAAGASSIKLTGKVGAKRLPAGSYTVLVRATNPAGVATARAGRLRLKP